MHPIIQIHTVRMGQSSDLLMHLFCSLLFSSWILTFSFPFEHWGRISGQGSTPFSECLMEDLLSTKCKMDDQLPFWWTCPSTLEGDSLCLQISKGSFATRMNDGLKLDMSCTGIRQVVMRNAHAYQERTAKWTKKNRASIVSWCIGSRFFWGPWIPSSRQNKIFPDTKQLSPRNSQRKQEGTSLPFWSWLLRHSSPHHHSCRRLDCWWNHSSCLPWKAGK